MIQCIYRSGMPREMDPFKNERSGTSIGINEMVQYFNNDVNGRYFITLLPCLCCCEKSC